MGEQTLTPNFIAKPEVLALVESWLRDAPETLDIKGLHILTRMCALSVDTFKDTGVARCHPGRQYLANLVGWSVTQVSRFTSKLRDYGIVRKYQPRIFNEQKQRWDTLTTVYTLTLLTPLRIKELAVALGIKLGARMYLFPNLKKKEKKESCVQHAVRRAYVPVSRVAEHVYGRIMSLGKNAETKGEIHTGDVKRDAELNRFAKLGQRQT